MYIPKAFAKEDLQCQHDLMRAYSFATFITHYEYEFQISHVPTILNTEIGQYGRLAWHVAKANPHAEILAKAEEVLCIFQGPHHYISPLWYSKLPDAPTWNYAVIHAYGKAEIISQTELAEDLDQLVAANEVSLHGDQAYQVPKAYQATLIDHIVGFRLNITKLESKFKLSQNRSIGVQKNIVNALHQQGSPDAKALTHLMEIIKR